MSALERLNQLTDLETFLSWINNKNCYNELVSDIQEVVALANQQTSIGAMRFELAKAAMQGLLVNSNYHQHAVVNSVKYADAIMAELQKPKP